MKLSVSIIPALLLAAAEAREFLVADNAFIVGDDSALQLGKRAPRERIINADAFTLEIDNLDTHLDKRGHHGKKKGHHKCSKSTKHKTTSKPHSDSLPDFVHSTYQQAKKYLWSVFFPQRDPSLEHLVMQDGQLEAITDLIVENPEHGEAPKGGPTLLRTALTVHPEIYNFVSYIRDSELFAGRFNHENKYSIVFAPTDAALNNLGSKPWEFPTPVEGSSEEEDQKVIESNIANFISSHVSFEKELSVGTHVTTMNGVVVTLAESKNNYKAVLAIDATGRSIVAEVIGHYLTGNGEIYIIDNCLIKP